ncbi:MAG: alpha/beta hydrolase [Actinomycetia bacterium]|nr:alpha/beta hydrolase [Actinomycetes bacterium]
MTRWVTGLDGVRLAVEDAGPADGVPVVLVHGYSQARWCWTKQFASARLGEFRLVAPDLRGHGESDKPRGPYGAREWAGDLSAVITALGLERPVLVGWSYGGMVVGDFLAAYGPEAVRGIVLVAATGERGTERACSWRGPERLALGDGLGSDDAEASVAALQAFVALLTARPLDAAAAATLLGTNVMVPPYVRRALDARTGSHESTFAAYRGPALVIHGEADRIVLPEAARTQAAWMPQATLRIYPGVGHMPFWEAPEQFDADLAAFLTAVRG